jgi:transcriptional regulator with XRE-family HTH domain
MDEAEDQTPAPASFRIDLPPDIESPFGPLTATDIGMRIAHDRQLFGSTQAEFAEGLGVSRKTVVRWEAGKSRPTRPQFEQLIERLAGIFGRWVACRAQCTRPDPEELRAQGFQNPVNLADYVEEAAVRLAVDSELLHAVSLFGGHVCATKEDWCEAFRIPHRYFDGVPSAYDTTEGRFYWGFDCGYVLEAAMVGLVYSELLESITPDNRHQLKDFAELRLREEASLRLSWMDLWEVRCPLTEEESEQNEHWVLSEDRFGPRSFGVSMAFMHGSPPDKRKGLPEYRKALKRAHPFESTSS